MNFLVFHKQHWCCLRAQSTDRKECMHTHFLVYQQRSLKPDLLRGIRMPLQVCNALPSCKWNRHLGGKTLCLAPERGGERSRGSPARDVWGSSCISMQCLVYSPGVIKGLDFLCLLVDSSVHCALEPLNSLEMCLRKCGWVFLLPTAAGPPPLPGTELPPFRDVYQHCGMPVG